MNVDEWSSKYNAPPIYAGYSNTNSYACGIKVYKDSGIMDNYGISSIDLIWCH